MECKTKKLSVHKVGYYLTSIQRRDSCRVCPALNFEHNQFTKCVYQDGRGDEEDAGGVHEVRERDQRVRAAGDVPLVAHPRARPRQPGRRQRDDRGHQRDGVH